MFLAHWHEMRRPSMERPCLVWERAGVSEEKDKEMEGRVMTDMS